MKIFSPKLLSHFLAGLIFGLTIIFSGFLLAYSAPNTFKIADAKFSRSLYEAKYYETNCLGVKCSLCPFECFLPEGQIGICKVRINLAGKLYSMVYGKIGAAHLDPVEKKPIFHLLPGSTAYSIATAGCNLGCVFCQNWDIAQSRPEEVKAVFVTPQQVVDAAIKSGSKSIAYTYSEPVVFYEFVLDTAKLAKINGLKNIMVTSGFINSEPLKELAPYIDVFKIDLKGFNEEYYRKTCGAPLQPVLDTLILLKREGKFVEIVNLIVPGLNDKPEEIEKMCKWIYDNLGKDTPVFFSRFHPDYRLVNLPPTPLDTLEAARRTALNSGLEYAYLGNVPGSEGENTYCPGCYRLLIKRYGYAVLENNIVNGKCKYCGKVIPGIWE